jgi:hypothetical protein
MVCLGRRDGVDGIVSAIKLYEGFGDVDHTIKELMSFWDCCAA